MNKDKQTLLTVTKKDFRWEYFNGSGAGGQNRNRKKNCVRLFHDPSKTSSVAQDQKNKAQNEKAAFVRLVNQKQFQDWLKLESARRAGQLEDLNAKVKKQLLNAKVETKNQKGKWEEDPSLKISEYDIKNSFE